MRISDWSSDVCSSDLSGHAAHRFVTEVEAGMLGVNVPVPVPVGHHNFGGLRRSKFGDAHMFGPDAARFYTKMKTVSQRWPEPEQSASSSFSLAFPSNQCATDLPLGRRTAVYGGSSDARRVGKEFVRTCRSRW